MESKLFLYSIEESPCSKNMFIRAIRNPVSSQKRTLHLKVENSEDVL